MDTTVTVSIDKYKRMFRLIRELQARMVAINGRWFKETIPPPPPQWM